MKKVVSRAAHAHDHCPRGRDLSETTFFVK